MAEPAAKLTPVEGPVEIPDRLFFRIGDVAELTGIEAYVLRYWETEFPKLAPKKASNGQREYRRKDVETVLEIKRLLYDEGYTIAGARRYMKDGAKRRKKEVRPAPVQGGLFGPEPGGADPKALAEIKKDLRAILNMLK